MARYDLDYEASYGMGYRRTGRGEMHRGSPRRFRRGRHRDAGWFGREREYTGREPQGYEGDMPGYGREFTGWRDYDAYGEEYGGMHGYGAEYRKSRWQTDYGDPFHDRERGTPFRMIHGEFEGYGEEYTGYGEDYGYGRGFTSRGDTGRTRRGRWLGSRHGATRRAGRYSDYGTEPRDRWSY